MPESPEPGSDSEVTKDYKWKAEKEAEFWGTMARLRWRGGIPVTMDFQLGTRYRVRRSDLGWSDYFQDPALEAMTPFGRSKIRLINEATSGEGKNTLDLCCGAGWLALEHARAGKKVDAVDLSHQEIGIAQEYQATLTETIPGEINWINTDLNSFTAEEGKYEVCTAWDGLHHIQEIDRLCGEIHKSLKPGGRFMMSERIWSGDELSLRARLGKYIEQTLWTFLPTPAPPKFRTKFKELLVTYWLFVKIKIFRQKHESVEWQLENEEFCSPFEDACGAEMIGAIKKYFIIEKYETYGGFSEEIQRSLYLPRFLRVPAILLISWLDHLVVKLGLLEGKLMVLYGRRKDDSQL